MTTRSRAYGGALPQAIEKHLEATATLTPQERYSLDVEVDLVRMVLGETLSMFTAAKNSSDSDTKAMAVIQIRTALEFAMTRIAEAAKHNADQTKNGADVTTALRAALTGKVDEATLNEAFANLGANRKVIVVR